MRNVMAFMPVIRESECVYVVCWAITSMVTSVTKPLEVVTIVPSFKKKKIRYTRASWVSLR